MADSIKIDEVALDANLEPVSGDKTELLDQHVRREVAKTLKSKSDDTMSFHDINDVMRDVGFDAS